MRHVWQFFVPCVAVALLASPPTHSAPPRFLPLPPSIWKAGDGWPLVVEYSSPEARAAVGSGKNDPSKAVKPVRYEMVVVVTSWPNRPIPSWYVKFLVPRKDAPAKVGQQGGMIVQTKDGLVVSALLDHFEGPIRKVDFAAPIQTVGEVEIITNPPEGFPMDVFFAPMDYDQSEFTSAGNRLTLKKEQSENKITLEATYKPAKGDELRVRQVWMQGEKWWREFERYRGGKKELRAWIPDFYFAKQKEKERRKAALDAKGQSGASATQRPQPGKEPPPAREDERELRDDPRLRVPLNLQLKQSTVEQVLQHLRTATTVELDSDANLNLNVVAFGSLSLTNVPAWQVMMKLATCPAVAGRWQKSDTGYRLFGAPPAPPPSRVSISWRVSLSMVALGVILALLYWFRKRQAQHTQTTSKPPVDPKLPSSPR